MGLHHCDGLRCHRGAACGLCRGCGNDPSCRHRCGLWLLGRRRWWRRCWRSRAHSCSGCSRRPRRSRSRGSRGCSSSLWRRCRGSGRCARRRLRRTARGRQRRRASPAGGGGGARSCRRRRPFSRPEFRCPSGGDRRGRLSARRGARCSSCVCGRRSPVDGGRRRRLLRRRSSGTSRSSSSRPLRLHHWRRRGRRRSSSSRGGQRRGPRRRGRRSRFRRGRGPGHGRSCGRSGLRERARPWVHGTGRWLRFVWGEGLRVRGAVRCDDHPRPVEADTDELLVVCGVGGGWGKRERARATSTRPSLYTFGEEQSIERRAASEQRWVRAVEVRVARGRDDRRRRCRHLAAGRRGAVGTDGPLLQSGRCRVFRSIRSTCRACREPRLYHDQGYVCLRTAPFPPKSATSLGTATAPARRSASRYKSSERAERAARRALPAAWAILLVGARPPTSRATAVLVLRGGSLAGVGSPPPGSEASESPGAAL